MPDQKKKRKKRAAKGKNSKGDLKEPQGEDFLEYLELEDEEFGDW